MADLYIAVVILIFVSAGALFLGEWLSRRLSPRDAGLLLMFSVLVLLAYEKLAADKLWIARLLPFSNVVILGNLFPPLVAFLSGLAWHRLPTLKIRKLILLIPLIILSWTGIAQLLFSSPPRMGNRWTRRVCLQTSESSCSAAAGATLLAAYGIPSTEHEMAELCLTRPAGTSMLGLYRGLKLKTNGTNLKPLPFTGLSIDELAKTATGPVLLSVELLPGETLSEKYQQYGFGVGVRHSVVVFRFLPNNLVEVGDPATGRERWSFDDLRVLWHGEAIRLVKRS